MSIYFIYSPTEGPPFVTKWGKIHRQRSRSIILKLIFIYDCN